MSIRMINGFAYKNALSGDNCALLALAGFRLMTGNDAVSVPKCAHNSRFKALSPYSSA